MLRVIFILTIFTSQFSVAGINLFNGDYSRTEVDFTTPSGQLSIQRTYNSKGRFQGLFGLGWCSNLETRLEIKKTEITLVECGDGRHITFAWNTQLGSYASANWPQYKIQKTHSGYRRSMGVALIEDFNIQGELVKRILADGSQFTLIRQANSSAITQILTGSGEAVGFQFGKDKVVIKDQGASLEYVLENGLLKSVVYPDGKKTLYSYDLSQHLQKIVSRDNDQVTIGYVQGGDRVQQLTTKDGCVQLLSYEPAGKNKYEILTSKKCSGESTEKKYLLTLNQKGQPTDLEEKGEKPRQWHYGSRFPRIESKIEGDVSTLYKYDGFGRVVAASSGDKVLQYTYAKRSHLPKSVTMVTLSSKKPVRTLASYDENLRFLEIKNDQAKISFEYAAGDRLSKIKFGGKKTLQIGYDPAGRVETLTDSDQGRVKLTYSKGRLVPPTGGALAQYQVIYSMYEKAVSQMLPFTYPRLVEEL